MDARSACIISLSAAFAAAEAALSPLPGPGAYETAPVNTNLITGRLAFGPDGGTNVFTAVPGQVQLAYSAVRAEDIQFLGEAAHRRLSLVERLNSGAGQSGHTNWVRTAGPYDAPGRSFRRADLGRDLGALGTYKTWRDVHNDAGASLRAMIADPEEFCNLEPPGGDAGVVFGEELDPDVAPESYTPTVAEIDSVVNRVLYGDPRIPGSGSQASSPSYFARPFPRLGELYDAYDELYDKTRLAAWGWVAVDAGVYGSNIVTRPRHDEYVPRYSSVQTGYIAVTNVPESITVEPTGALAPYMRMQDGGPMVRLRMTVEDSLVHPVLVSSTAVETPEQGAPIYDDRGNLIGYDVEMNPTHNLFRYEETPERYIYMVPWHGLEWEKELLAGGTFDHRPMESPVSRFRTVDARVMNTGCGIVRLYVPGPAPGSGVAFDKAKIVVKCWYGISRSSRRERKGDAPGHPSTGTDFQDRHAWLAVVNRFPGELGQRGDLVPPGGYGHGLQALCTDVRLLDLADSVFGSGGFRHAVGDAYVPYPFGADGGPAEGRLATSNVLGYAVSYYDLEGESEYIRPAVRKEQVELEYGVMPVAIVFTGSLTEGTDLPAYRAKRAWAVEWAKRQ